MLNTNLKYIEDNLSDQKMNDLMIDFIDKN